MFNRTRDKSSRRLSTQANLTFVVCCCFFQPEKAQGKRKKRAKKDADAPKRPMSAYMLWLGEVREQLKQENPGISVTELSKVAGERWKQIDDKTVSFTQGCLVISQRILRRNW